MILPKQKLLKHMEVSPMFEKSFKKKKKKKAPLGCPFVTKKSHYGV